MSERLARAALSRLGEPGDVRLTRLVRELGAAEVFGLLREEQDLEGVYTDVAGRLREIDPERELAEAAARGIRYVCPGDDEWPDGLDDLDGVEPLLGRGGSPLGVWVRGPLRLDEVCRRAVAVVGSRSGTTYGAQVASELSAHVAGQGVCVVSGAAYGIDVAAHRGALAARGPTVAVLACGVDRAYPSGHRRVLDYIADTGAVVSELPPGCAPTKLRFLSRNRIIAAMGQGTVVVEAAVRSGALNTANWASRLSRVVMGVPGPVTSAPSQGVHELIRGRGAMLVTRGEDVMELLSPSGSFLVEEPRGPERTWDRLSPSEQRVLDAVPAMMPVTVDSVARTAGLAPGAVAGALATLAAAGLVEQLAQGWRLRRPGAVAAGVHVPGTDGSSA